MVRIDSFAKINLLLRVDKKRRDGYHAITTVLERLSLKDRLTFTLTKDSTLQLTCSLPGLACDSTNLVMRAALLLRKETQSTQGARIHLTKRIPVGSGMAGGSSNAAAALAGLNRLWKLKLPQRRLVKLASMLGSDVPFFLYNCSFALATGRGERVIPWKALRQTRLWHVIVVPRVAVSTPAIYKAWDEWQARAKAKKSPLTRLTSGKYSAKLISLALKKKDLSSLTGSLFNSLEPVTQRSCPHVARVKKALADRGVKTILMSGSGPAVFGIVSSRKEALGLAARLSRNRFWRIFVAHTW